MHLKDYLNFIIVPKEYEANLVAANKDVEDLRKTFVQDKFNKLDVAEKTCKKHERWAWFPMFRILKEWPLPDFHGSPWEHTEHEWLEIEKILIITSIL